MKSDTGWMSAAAAAERLQVSRATLYAYVSRGFVRSQAVAGSARERAYSREDVEGLKRRGEERRDPARAAARALQWGVPVLESGITLIDGHRLYYRGHDALTLAGSRSIQEVAALIWTGRFDPVFAAEVWRGPGRRPRGNDTLPFVARAQSLLAAAAAADPIAVDTAERVALAGWRILQLVTAAAAGAHDATATIERRLAAAWRVRGPGEAILRSALILCADHELNVSSFTARCVASAGSSPYAAVIAGLAALEGPRHGGASSRVEAMLSSMRKTRDAGGAIAARLRRGDRIDGFGHPLYPQGDPRAAMLLGLLRERYAGSPELAFVSTVGAAAARVLREPPNLDFALAALARVLRLPPGAPLMLFAIGRTIGWIGHAIEQYATGQLIRPRARYVGPSPAAGVNASGVA